MAAPEISSCFFFLALEDSLSTFFLQIISLLLANSAYYALKIFYFSSARSFFKSSWLFCSSSFDLISLVLSEVSVLIVSLSLFSLSLWSALILAISKVFNCKIDYDFITCKFDFL
jgi:hypothetical protein